MDSFRAFAATLPGAHLPAAPEPAMSPEDLALLTEGWGPNQTRADPPTPIPNPTPTRPPVPTPIWTPTPNPLAFTYQGPSSLPNLYAGPPRATRSASPFKRPKTWTTPPPSRTRRDGGYQ